MQYGHTCTLDIFFILGSERFQICLLDGDALMQTSRSTEVVNWMIFLWLIQNILRLLVKYIALNLKVTLCIKLSLTAE